MKVERQSSSGKMKSLKIYNAVQASPELIDWLRESIAPHELLLPESKPASVLAVAPGDARMMEADIIVGQPDAAAVMNSGKLRWLQISSAGFTRYDTPEFKAAMRGKGVVVSNSSHVYDQACAEHVFAFMLANARQLPRALATHCANGVPQWDALRTSCHLLQGQSVAIFGYGAIAERLVAMLAPFEMEITGLRRKPAGDEVVRVVSMNHALTELSRADHVINILPDNPASRGYFDAAKFAAMKPGAVFYNIGRGTTVDQDALAAELQAGRLAAAWLDVTDPEPLPEDHALWSFPNCYITPHTAGGQGGETRVLLDHFLKNLRRFEAGEPLVNRIV